MPGSRSGHGGQGTGWVVGEFDDSLVVMRYSEAKRLAALNDALLDAATWGDLLLRIEHDPEALSELQQRYGDELPDDPESFEADEIQGFADGSWPASPKTQMTRWLPESIGSLGVVSGTLFDDDVLQIDVGRRSDVILSLRHLGPTWREDDELIARACGASRYA